MKILLLGKNGQVGFELQRTLAMLAEVLAYDQDVANFLDPNSVRDLIQSISPNVIVNAAAYTAVDKAETDKSLCHAINAAGPGLLAEEARSRNALLVHYSTDYVYPGNSNTPYREEDSTGPLGEYGRSKLEGDRLIQQSGVHHLTFRTAWVYGSRGQNFLLTMLRLAKERPELRIVSDQIGAPTWSRMIAEATALAIARAAGNPAAYSGVYHLTAAGETSWFGFTEAIFDTFAPVPRPKLTPITTDQYPTPARRPAYSVLSNEKFARTFGLKMPDWRTQLSLVASEMGVPPKS
ncbi:MAG TPA: dTDP-4-dehydrorhamnose reductase [Terriglobales bacterium]|nr:dTDP-4-dehydrorhamnose reductase [Terriglobales bacterium]